MPDDLMTLTMTREVFPDFKKMLESVRFPVDGGAVGLAVEEGAPGVIELRFTRFHQVDKE